MEQCKLLIQYDYILTKRMPYEERYTQGKYHTNMKAEIRMTPWTFLVVQWVRKRLLMHGTWAPCPVWEDSRCCGATKAVHHNDWVHALEPVNCNYWSLVSYSPCSAKEKPQQWEARAPQPESSPSSPQLEKACVEQWRLSTAKNK